jgi:hypothetical protein
VRIPIQGQTNTSSSFTGFGGLLSAIACRGGNVAAASLPSLATSLPDFRFKYDFSAYLNLWETLHWRGPFPLKQVLTNNQLQSGQNILLLEVRKKLPQALH